MNNKDMPAMPADSAGNSGAPYYKKIQALGLTKREMFAMHAMQGIISRSGEDIKYKETSRMAVFQADALLAALETE